MRLLCVTALLFCVKAIALENNRNAPVQQQVSAPNVASKNRSCAVFSKFETYKWGDDDLFEIESCLAGYDKGIKYLEFQNTDQPLCFIPHFTVDAKLATKIKFDVVEQGFRLIFEFDEARYCGMAGRDKLLMVDTTAVWAMPPGVVDVLLSCLEYNQRAQQRPDKYLAKAQKTCSDLREKYLQTLVYLKEY